MVIEREQYNFEIGNKNNVTLKWNILKQEKGSHFFFTNEILEKHSSTLKLR